MFDTFIDSLPAKCMSTDDFEFGTKFRKKESSLEYKYIQLNQLYKKYLVVDVDEDRRESVFCFEELGLPVPTIITINSNPKNGRFNTPHFLWELKTPVIYTEAGRSAPQRLYERVDNALTKALRPFKSDLNYVGLFTKNPLHPNWKTIKNEIAYDLEDFCEYLDIGASKRNVGLELDAEGRNCTIFHNLRFWAYREVREHKFYEDFLESVRERGYVMNTELGALPCGNLPFKEVLAIANSIGRWTWRHRFSLDGIKNRGIMLLNTSDLALEEKQRLSATRTNTVQKNATRTALLTSITLMKAQGTPITQKSLEVHSKVSLRTIKNYWSELESMVYQATV
jgi:hypothetical protein